MPDRTKRHVLIVCGYGCDVSSPLGSIYLPRVGNFIIRYKPDFVALCGGRTQRQTHPGHSEAGTMSRVLHDYLKTANTHPVYTLEEDSYTTLENIRGAADRVNLYKRLHECQVHITIFCEATRALKVAMLARHFFYDAGIVERPGDIVIETASWELADPVKEVRNTVYDWFAIRFPRLGLAQRARQRRLKRAETA